MVGIEKTYHKGFWYGWALIWSTGQNKKVK